MKLLERRVFGKFYKISKLVLVLRNMPSDHKDVLELAFEINLIECSK